MTVDLRTGPLRAEPPRHRARDPTRPRRKELPPARPLPLGRQLLRPELDPQRRFELGQADDVGPRSSGDDVVQRAARQAGFLREPALRPPLAGFLDAAGDLLRVPDGQWCPTDKTAVWPLSRGNKVARWTGHSSSLRHRQRIVDARHRPSGQRQESARESRITAIPWRRPHCRRRIVTVMARGHVASRACSPVPEPGRRSRPLGRRRAHTRGDGPARAPWRDSHQPFRSFAQRPLWAMRKPKPLAPPLSYTGPESPSR